MTASHNSNASDRTLVGATRATRLAAAVALALVVAGTSMVAVAGDAPGVPQRWVPPMSGSTLRAGDQLSTAFKRYAAMQGWTFEWRLSEEYALDNDLQLPGTNVVADAQWLIKSYQARGVMSDVGVEVDMETKRVTLLRTAGTTAQIDRDPVVQMRMSSLSVDPSRAETVKLTQGARSTLVPLPSAAAPTFAVQPASSRLIPLSPMPKDPDNPGLRLAPMAGMPIAPVANVQAAATLIAAREADRQLAERAAAAWKRVVSQSNVEPQTVDLQALLPPPSSVREIPTATASIGAGPQPTSRPGALSLGAWQPPAADTATSEKVSIVAKGVEPTMTAPAATDAATAPSEAAVWTATNGSSLRSAIEAWGERAGWVIKWDARIDYAVVGNLTFKGSFLDAVEKLFDAYGATARPLRADAYARQNLILVQE